MTKRQSIKLKGALKKQGTFLMRLLFGETLTIIALLFLSGYAFGQELRPAPYALTVSHNASGRGVVTGGCASVVTINGGQFTSEAQSAIKFPLGFQIAGISVTVDERPAALWYVGTDKISFIAPYVTTPIKPHRIAWHQIVVRTPTDTFRGWVAYAPTAPGIYEQVNNGFTHAQGLYQLNPRFLMAITDLAIPSGSRLALFGSGMRNAGEVRVWVDDGFDTWIVQGTLPDDPINSLAGFAWIEDVAFTLPPDAHGLLLIVVQADNMWSQEVFINVQ